MKQTYYFGVVDRIAKNNGYKDEVDLLRDYGFIPTVMTPKHKKIEIVLLLLECLNKRKR